MKINLYKKEIIFFVILAFFSFFLMFKTFRVTNGGEMKIATKVWSDFAATIPLVRSFSLGNNFPPEYPLFAGPHIRYHFIFYMLVGFLEKVGLRLDLALNLLSAIGFFLLLLIIYFLGEKIFKKKSVGVLTVVLFLFNGSLSFLEFFKTHSISSQIISAIINSKEFASFGPYDGKIISAFWSLNIFTNQRHLAFAYFFFLLLILLCYHYFEEKKIISKKEILAISLMIGLFPFFHLAVFGMMEIALGVLFLVLPKFRKEVFVIGLISLAFALPQIIYMGPPQVHLKIFQPGYLIPNPNLLNFVNYWVLNLGLTIILAPIGVLFAKKEDRKFILPFLALFIVGYIFRFSPEAAANHKFFNLFLIGANLFSANALVTFWNKNNLGKVLVVLSFLLVTLSGIIDLFPIINDSYISIRDKDSPARAFILKNTSAKSVFLNTTYLYDPASLAGRKIYLGWPYFSWSAGYNTDARFSSMQKILSGADKNSLCNLLNQEGIDYIEIQNPTTLEETIVNYTFFNRNFINIFKDPNLNISIFDVKGSCKK